MDSPMNSLEPYLQLLKFFFEKDCFTCKELAAEFHLNQKKLTYCLNQLQRLHIIYWNKKDTIYSRLELGKLFSLLMELLTKLDGQELKSLMNVFAEIIISIHPCLSKDKLDTVLLRNTLYTLNKFELFEIVNNLGLSAKLQTEGYFFAEGEEPLPMFLWRLLLVETPTTIIKKTHQILLDILHVYGKDIFFQTIEDLFEPLKDILKNIELKHELDLAERSSSSSFDISILKGLVKLNEEIESGRGYYDSFSDTLYYANCQILIREGILSEDEEEGEMDAFIYDLLMEFDYTRRNFRLSSRVVKSTLREYNFKNVAPKYTRGIIAVLSPLAPYIQMINRTHFSRKKNPIEELWDTYFLKLM